MRPVRSCWRRRARRWWWATTAAKPGRDARADGDAKGEGPADDLLRKVNRLKDEVIGDAAKAAVKERLGLGGDEEPVRVHGATKRPQKDLRVGAGLGLVGGPLGLFYAAPYPVAIATSAAYVAALVGLNFIPVVGSMLVAYLLPIVHLTSAAAGAGYTWRYNRAGRRAAEGRATSAPSWKKCGGCAPGAGTNAADGAAEPGP